MAAVAHSSTTVSPSHRAYQILHFGFVVAPIIAGADKFFDKLGDWDKYLAPQIASIIPAHTFMMIVGAIEIVAGLIVLTKPKIGAFIVAAWLLGIIINLIMLGNYYDVALRDLGLCLGALALGYLGIAHEKGEA